jgi:fructose-bisphosphate aldolase class I
VEPEILIEGPHSAAVFGGVTERVIGATVAQMWQKGVQLEGCLLKPQMVIPVSGSQSPSMNMTGKGVGSGWGASRNTQE